MNLNHRAGKSFLFFILFICCNTFALARNHSVMFFFSNNDQTLDMEQAFNRLTGIEQQQLEKKVIHIFQHEHMQQGTFEDILGAYTSPIQGTTTADNSEIYFVSPLQTVPRAKVFNLAKKLAIKLNQESVAVFIPSPKHSIRHISLTFSSTTPTIAEALEQIKDKLPAAYSQAFSLNLNTLNSGYNTATVHSIDWLGSHLDVDAVKNSFPSDKVQSDKGDAYLVYQNGEQDKL